MASPSQPWTEHIDDIDLDVALLYNNTSSGRSSPSPDQGLQTHPCPEPHLSRSASESQISPVGPTSLAPACPSTDLNTEAPPPDSNTTSTAGPSFLRHPNSASFRSQGSSPLNPFVPHSSFSPFARVGPRPSTLISRIPSEDSRALSVALPASIKTRGSMILYRRADLSDGLAPPPFPNRDSVLSTSGDSFFSLSADSKYPAGQSTTERGLVAYAFDPFLDDPDPTYDDPSDPDNPLFTSGELISGRGFRTLGMLMLMLAGLLSLFVVYPVFSFFHDNGLNALITENARINSTGQAVIVDLNPRSQIPISSFGHGIAASTPHDVWMRTGSDGSVYELVFSDEFDSDGRSFVEGNDLLWEADDPHYDLRQIYTQDGHLVISANALSSSVRFRLGTPFCLKNGFVEVGVVNAEGEAPKRIHWSGTWSSVDEGWDVVPHGSSLTQTLLLDLHFGVAVNDVGRSESVSAPPRDVLVDYVRVYQLKTITTSSCDSVTPPQRALAFLSVPHIS